MRIDPVVGVGLASGKTLPEFEGYQIIGVYVVTNDSVRGKQRLISVKDSGQTVVRSQAFLEVGSGRTYQVGFRKCISHACWRQAVADPKQISQLDQKQEKKDANYKAVRHAFPHQRSGGYPGKCHGTDCC